MSKLPALLEKEVRKIKQALYKGETVLPFLLLRKKSGSIVRLPIRVSSVEEKDYLELGIVRQLLTGEYDAIAYCQEVWYRDFGHQEEIGMYQAHDYGISSFDDKKEGWLWYCEYESGGIIYTLEKIVRSGSKITLEESGMKGEEIPVGRMCNFFEKARTAKKMIENPPVPENN